MIQDRLVNVYDNHLKWLKTIEKKIDNLFSLMDWFVAKIDILSKIKTRYGIQ